MGAQPVRASEGLPLVEPEVRRSVGGELSTSQAGDAVVKHLKGS